MFTQKSKNSKTKTKKRKRRKERRNEKKNKRAIFINVSKEIKSHRFKTKILEKKDNFNFNIKPAVKLQTPRDKPKLTSIKPNA